MKTVTYDTYTFEELSPEAQEKAIKNNYDWNVDGVEWYDFVYEDAKEAAKILGIEIEKIYFSGFSYQGDGAQFVGNYAYKKGAVKEIREHAPQDEELHVIAQELVNVQKKYFYGLEARVKHSGHYYHAYCTSIEVENNAEYGSYYPTLEDEKELQRILRSFMQWIYKRLNDEFDYQTSKDAIKESLIANEVYFMEDGTSE